MLILRVRAGGADDDDEEDAGMRTMMTEKTMVMPLVTSLLCIHSR